MAFSRTNLMAAVAGTLSVAVLAGCPGTPSQVGPSTTPGSTEPTTTPSGQPTAGATQPPSNLGTTTVRGQVFDENAGLVSSGAKLSVKSLNPSNPFDQTVDVINGSYVVNEAPAGVQLELKVTRDGYTSRTRVETLLPLASSQSQIINFGGPISTNSPDPIAPAYFISDFPEVESVSPEHDATGADASKINVVLTLSEPLTDTNRRRFANAVRLLPANAAALAAGALNPNVTDLDSLTSTATVGVTGAGQEYEYAAGIVNNLGATNVFLEDTNNTATVTWDASGKVATFSFNAPLKSDRNDEAKYQIALVAGDAETIVDGNGKTLGGPGTAGAKDSLILEAFKAASLSVNTSATTDALRWASTHRHNSVFSVAKDTTDPEISSAAIVGNNRIDLTFSEPMVKLGDKLGQTGTATVLDLSNYIFRSSTSTQTSVTTYEDTVSATNLDGSDNAHSFAALGNATIFKLDPAAFRVQVSPTDAKVVRLLPKVGSESAVSNIPTNIRSIQVKVKSGVQDNAGNGIVTSGDKNYVIGTL